MKNPWVCAALVHAKDLKKLAAFYRDVCGFPLQSEGPEQDHFGCEIGDVHFAIHSLGKGGRGGEGGYRLAFSLDDVDAFVGELKKRDVPVLMEPRDLGFGRLAMFRDPEGNVVEIVTLSESWMKHLKDLRKKRGAVPAI